MRPFGGEGAPQLGAHIHDPLPGLALEGGKLAAGSFAQASRPLLGHKIEAVRRQGPVVGLALRLPARLEGVGDHRQALVARLGGEMIDADQGPGRQIVKQGFQALIEQRQPVLHAGAPAALAHRGVERVFSWSPESGKIAAPEPGDGGGIQQSLAHGRQIRCLELAHRPLRFTVEGADGFERVAEQVQAHGLVGAGRKDINDAAAHGEFAPFRNRRGSLVAVDGEVAFQVGDIDAGAQGGGVSRLFDHGAGRNALREGRRGGDQQCGLFGLDASRQRGQGRHASGRHPGRGSHPVIGQAVPSRKDDHLDLRREESHGVAKGRRPRAIAGHERGKTSARAGDVAHGQGVETLRGAGQQQVAGRVAYPLEDRG